jgi:hypothetical protein
MMQHEQTNSPTSFPNHDHLAGGTFVAAKQARKESVDRLLSLAQSDPKRLAANSLVKWTPGQQEICKASAQTSVLPGSRWALDSTSSASAALPQNHRNKSQKQLNFERTTRKKLEYHATVSVRRELKQTPYQPTADRYSTVLKQLKNVCPYPNALSESGFKIFPVYCLYTGIGPLTSHNGMTILKPTPSLIKTADVFVLHDLRDCSRTDNQILLQCLLCAVAFGKGLVSLRRIQEEGCKSLSMIWLAPAADLLSLNIVVSQDFKTKFPALLSWLKGCCYKVPKASKWNLMMETAQQQEYGCNIIKAKSTAKTVTLRTLDDLSKFIASARRTAVARGPFGQFQRKPSLGSCGASSSSQKSIV